MSTQRVRSAVAVPRRSIHPGLSGLPWWAAVVLAVVATTLGVVLDAGGAQLTGVFAACYVFGCVAAVLAVQQAGVFTAVIQPPLILFCAVPGAYWLFHGGGFPGVKEILINCGYPLIERFPLMLFTSAAVLLIGMGRWYFGASARADTTPANAAEKPGGGSLSTLVDKLSARLAGLAGRDAAHASRPPTARSRRSAPRAARRTDPAARVARSGQRAAPTRSRHLRPPVGDPPDGGAERIRRRRPAAARTDEPPRREPRRSQRSARREPAAREARREPYPREPRREPYPVAGRRARRDAGADYPVFDSPEPRSPRRPARGAANGSGATHHPISQVRYRRADPDTDPRAQQRPRRTDHRADSRRYD